MMRAIFKSAKINEYLKNLRNPHVFHLYLTLTLTLLISVSILASGYLSERKNKIKLHLSFYNQKVKVLAQFMQNGRDVEDGIQQVVDLWQKLQDKSANENLCILDSNASLILNFLHPEAHGINISHNKMIWKGDCKVNQFADLVAQQCDYQGIYVAPGGEKQMAAFTYVSKYNVVIGVHRSLKLFNKQVNKSLNNYLIATLIAISILFPVSFMMIRLILRRLMEYIERTHKSIEDREEKFRSLAELVPASIAIIDRSHFIYVNKAWEDISGYTKKDAEDLNPLSIVHPDFKSKLKCKVIDHFRGNPVIENSEAALINKSGQTIWFEFYIRKIKMNAQDFILIVAMDINEKREARLKLDAYAENLEKMVKERTRELEEQTQKYIDSQKALTFLLEDVNESRLDLEKANKELDAVNKELESFSYSVSHDLRAPLIRMDGFSKALLKNYGDRLDEKATHYLERIRVSSQHMAGLINDLLTLSRLTRKEMRKTKVDMSSLAMKIIEELKDAEPLRKLSLDIDKDIQVEGDPAMMEVLMRNIIENAWKFSSTKEITKLIIGKEEDENKKTIFVKDNGVGFNMEYYDHLFQPFRRLHSDEEFPGTGVGLATVQRIVNRHKGIVWAESKINEGTVFYIEFNI